MRDRRGDMSPSLDGDGCDLWEGSPVVGGARGEVADDEDVGVVGDGEVVVDDDAATGPGGEPRALGDRVGLSDGIEDGALVGTKVGDPVGPLVGDDVGEDVGVSVGMSVGPAVG